MPQFTCMSCEARFHSAADLAHLADTTCSGCRSRLEPAGEPRRVLDDRLGHLIARREVARAQAQVDSERAAGTAT